MKYSEEILCKLALFHRAINLMAKLNREGNISQNLHDFISNTKKELVSMENIDIIDIISPDKFSHIKLSDEHEKFLEELKN